MKSYCTILIFLSGFLCAVWSFLGSSTALHASTILLSSSLPLYGYITICLSIHLLLDVFVVSSLGLLTTNKAPVNTHLCWCLLSLFLSKYLGIQWLGCKLRNVYLNFLGNKLSKATVPFCIPTIIHETFSCPTNSKKFGTFRIFQFNLDVLAVHCGISLWFNCAFPQWLMMLSIFFMCSLSICVCSLAEHLFKSLPHFQWVAFLINELRKFFI